MAFRKISLLILTATAFSACTTTGNTEKTAAIGAAGGALAGAIIGNNAGDGDGATGAVIGGLIGAAGGAYAGQQQDKNMNEPTRMKRGAEGQTLIYDSAAGRYYYTNPANGRSYWQDGSLRS